MSNGSYLASHGFIGMGKDLAKRLDEHLDIPQRLDPECAISTADTQISTIQAGRGRGVVMLT